MAIVAWIVFGMTATICVGTLWATIAPQRRLIVDLLVNGPRMVPVSNYAAPVRSVMRDVRVRTAVKPAPRRAAA